MDFHALSQNGARAEVTLQGAELSALCLGGHDLLWGAGPLWPRRAPLLFPVVGALAGDTLRHRGTAHPMPKHGFARDRAFTWTDRSARGCTLELRDDARTRAAYPFPFALTVSYTLAPTALRMDLALHNPGPEPLPASLGLHPAFRWPLAPGMPKAEHRLVFQAEEPGPLRRIDAAGLLTPTLHPTPIQGRVLPLHEGLFVEDALLFLEPRSRGLRFEAPGGPTLTLAWEGFPHLGVWTRPDPGPAFLCLEPWAGHASPAGWDGEISHKPGGFLIEAGATRQWSLTVGVEG